MGNNPKDEEKEKGFAVRDKRFSAKAEEDVQANGEKIFGQIPKEDFRENDLPLAEINFTHFILSLSTSALIQLGEIQDPATKEISKKLPLAKQTIDLIGILKEKTKGNLTPEEAKILEGILYDLRMRYVKAAT